MNAIRIAENKSPAEGRSYWWPLAPPTIIRGEGHVVVGQRRAVRLELLNRGAQLLESTLVLGAGLARAVAEVVDLAGLCLGFRYRLSHSLSDGLRGTLELGAGFSGAVTEMMNLTRFWGLYQHMADKNQKRRVNCLPGSGSAFAAACASATASARARASRFALEHGSPGR